MIWLRKGIVHLLSLLLLVTLLGSALATSIDINLSHPAKIEGWLGQSNLYDNFVANAITQAQKSVNNQDTSSASFNIPAVQQAAESAFSPQLIQQSVNTFLDSNYAWLQGKTSQPEFTIDLTDAKQSFAKQVGQYIQTHLAGLPVCTPAQIAQLPNPNDVDPLSLTCRPASLTPAAAGAQVTQKLASSDGFLGNPVITAQAFPQKDNGSNSPSQPYYQKLAKAPQAYRWGQKLPYLLGALALLFMLGIVFIAPRRRKGVRRVGVVLLIAGILLIAAKFVADYVFKKIQNKVFTGHDVGQIQKALVDFGHRVQHQITLDNLYFGLAFLLLALVIFTVLHQTRQRGARPAPVTPVADDTDDQPDQADTVQLAPRPRRPQTYDITSPQSLPKSDNGKPAQPPRPKRPRLIQ